MDGELAQTIALIAHGNAYLDGDGPPAPDLQSDTTTMLYLRPATREPLGRSSQRRSGPGCSAAWARGATSSSRMRTTKSGMTRYPSQCSAALAAFEAVLQSSQAPSHEG